MITDTITLGNILTIITIVIGIVGAIIAFSGKVTSMEQKLATQTKETDKIQELCANCFMRGEVEKLKAEKDRMNTEQIKLRAQLPLQLEKITGHLTDVIKSVATLQKDVTRIKNGLAKSKFVDIEEEKSDN